MSLKAEARRAAKRYGLNPRLFVRQIRQESRFNKDAVSPAGAIGVAQIMPDTARGWGVNPHDPIASLDAAAKNMAGYVRKYGSYRDALVAYNAGPGAVGGPLPAETRNYLKTILGAHGDQGSKGLRAPSSRSYIKPGTLPQSHQDIDSAILDSVMAHSRNKSKDIMRRLDSGQYNIETPGTAPSKVTIPGGKASAPTGSGTFHITGAHPERLTKSLLAFAHKVAAQYGQPLTGDSGATHSKFTVDGNVSDHWSGNATDIPATGKRLIAMGRAALIAAGMDPKQAAKANGGLYNVNGHQVIFNTHQGGDHTNHLHISV